MARKKSSSPSVDTPEKNVQQGKYWLPNDATWFGFLNVSLSEAEKEEFHVWHAENEKHVPGYLDELVGEGMKYSCAYDRENECYITTFTGALMDGANVRCATTSRAGTWAMADALAVWKHFIYMKQDYTTLRPNGRKNNFG